MNSPADPFGEADGVDRIGVVGEPELLLIVVVVRLVQILLPSFGPPPIGPLKIEAGE
jgi:hypothetical protein